MAAVLITNPANNDLGVMVLRMNGSTPQAFRTDSKVFENFNILNRALYCGDAASTVLHPFWLFVFPAEIIDPGVYGIAAYRRITPTVDSANDVLTYKTDYTFNGLDEGFTPSGIAVATRQEMDANSTAFKLLAGLAGQHSVFMNPSYDVNGNLTAATIRVYDTAGHASANDGVTGLLFVFQQASVYGVGGKLAQSTLTRVS